MPVQISCKRCHRPIERRGAHFAPSVRCPACGFTFSPRRSAGQRAPAAREPVLVDGLRLRPDLVIEPVEEEGALYFVIKDPASERFFRVKPLEHFLISQFDGATPLDTIRRRASEEKKVLVSEEVLVKFAEKFRELGLLVPEAAPPAAARASRRGLQWTGFLTFKLPLARPQALVDWVYPKVRLCFTKPFVVFAALAIALAAGLALAHRSELAFGLVEAVSVEGLLLVVATITAVTFVHELAHAVTCRHFGGRVSDMGFLFLYLLPCFYVNVSDTYLFRERRERLWVLFAGGFMELFVWALAVLGWRVLAPDVFFSRVLFAVIAVCGVRSLFNFNPLIKMDGYFLLSDVLGITNLRREALDGLSHSLRKLARIDAPEPSPAIRERRILAMQSERFLALFGGAALVYTALLVGLLVAYSGGFVFRNFGADALVVFSIGLVGLLHKPAFTAASAAKEAGKEKWQKLGEEKKRSRFTLVWGGLLLAAALCPWPIRVPSDLRVFAEDRATVRAPFPGRIAQIHVGEGDFVEKGDLLLEYDANELLLQREAKEAELERAREGLRQMVTHNPVDLADARVAERNLELAKVQEDAAKREFARAQSAWTEGLISKETFDQAENALNEAASSRRKAEAELTRAREAYRVGRMEDLRKVGTSPEEQQQTIHMLEEEVKTLDDRLSRTKIYAPLSGRVATYRFQEKLGDYLDEGAEVCEIVNAERVVVEMPVNEKDMDVIEDGLQVKFKVRGYPTRSFYGTVDEIAPVAMPNEGASTVLVRSYVDNKDDVLKPGMTGVAKIYCGTSVVAHILTRDLIRFIRTEFWL